MVGVLDICESGRQETTQVVQWRVKIGAIMVENQVYNVPAPLVERSTSSSDGDRTPGDTPGLDADRVGARVRVCTMQDYVSCVRRPWSFVWN